MRKVLVVLVVFFAFAGSLLAGDNYYSKNDNAKYKWSGYYVGFFNGTINSKIAVADVSGYNGDNINYKANGILSSFYGGYNWRYKDALYGLEMELGYMDIGGSQQYPAFIGIRNPDDSLASIDSDFYTSLTSRLGFIYDKALFYLKVGVTGLNTQVSYVDNDTTGTILVLGTKKRKFLWGPTAGAGIEYSIDRRWSIRAEYMYINFGKISQTTENNYGAEFIFTHDPMNVHNFKVGISYNF